MTTLTSRKTARQYLATLLDAVTTFVTVYDHQTADIKRESPVAMVWSDGTKTFWPGYAYEHHYFWVAIYWKRDDADATEDYIDDLSKETRQKLMDNPEVSGKWHELAFDEEPAQMGYLVIDGVLWRFEQFRVIAVSICDNT